MGQEKTLAAGKKVNYLRQRQRIAQDTAAFEKRLDTSTPEELMESGLCSQVCANAPDCDGDPRLPSCFFRRRHRFPS